MIPVIVASIRSLRIAPFSRFADRRVVLNPGGPP